ncbi:MAG: glycoprotein [Prochlorococcus marinus CUG1439]|uniref:glycoprotein n=1 Tax=Prochlorococcus sp. MIT 1314 TaxID=3096220 RepID=UPI002A5F1918|nr:glycoprotein [Prochlorococcus sp. MIT 1314]MCR8539949.1 glycoprotein [Prochlorococcus marinus CUG1439]
MRNSLKLNRKKKVFKAKELMIFNKKNLDNWMNLTKKERYNLSKKESFNYLDKRKLLLEEIRKEYKKISRGNCEKNIKEK